jgi:hypothetical protein
MQVTKTLLIYGKTKVGKTLDVCYTFGKSAFVILSEPDGLASVEANLGFMPEHFELTNIANPYVEVMALLQKDVLPRIKLGKIKCVIFDTGSEFADRILSVELEKAGADKRRAYQPMYQMFTNVVRTILLAGAWTVMVCHEKIGDAENDRRGGPLLPGRLVESVPSQFSLILRAVVRNGQRMYVCEPLDPDWITGDRYGACFDEQPMELRAIMWRIAHPGEDTPAEMLLGKPIRMGGKLYAPGTLPKRTVPDLLSTLDGDKGGVPAPTVALSGDDLLADTAPAVELALEIAQEVKEPEPPPDAVLAS